MVCMGVGFDRSKALASDRTASSLKALFAKSKDVATFEVTILDSNKKYYKFKWQVEKYNLEGNLKDCWLTTAVSQPMPLGSSI